MQTPQLWLGLVTGSPGQVSVAHQHGAAQTAAYVLRGHLRISSGEQYAQSVDVGPGDFVYIPPFAQHREQNLSETEPVALIVAWSPGYMVTPAADHDGDQDGGRQPSHGTVAVVRGAELDGATGQIKNLPMRTGVETPQFWLGRATGAPGQDSGAHHHGEAQTAVYVLSGHTRIFYGDRYREYVQLGPGDFMYVPPFLPHIERNSSDTEPVEFVALRTPRNIVVNFEGQRE